MSWIKKKFSKKMYSVLVVFALFSNMVACKQKQEPLSVAKNSVKNNDSFKPDLNTVVRDTVLNTAGFFLDNWVEKKFVLPPSIDSSKPVNISTTSIDVFPLNVLGKVSPAINGNNANTFSGQMATEDKLVSNIKDLNPGIIRFPGGDVSSTYFWNKTNLETPKDIPTSIFVSNGSATTSYLWFGKNNEPWTMSLDNYYKLLQLTSSKGMITVNYSYARYGTSPNPVQTAAHLAADWVRYDKGRTKYWEVGNESYGYWEAGWKIDKKSNKDNQPEIITGELYGAHFKVFADSMRKAAAEIGSDIKIGAVLIGAPTPNSINPAEALWNNGYFSKVGDLADYYIVHDYFTNFGENSTAQTILNSAASQINIVKNYVKKSFQQNNRIEKPIAMTEWNIFATGNNQRVSTIAGLHAVLAMGEMLESNFGMAARWGLLGKYTNGDDFATISIGDEPDNKEKWNPRPIFYYMYYFNTLVGDKLVESRVNGDGNVVAYASTFSGVSTSVILVNKSTIDQVVTISIDKWKPTKYYYYYILTGDEGTTFSRKVFINGFGPNGVSGGPKNYKLLPAYRSETAGGIKLTLPKYSAVFLVTSGN